MTFEVQHVSDDFRIISFQRMERILNLFGTPQYAVKLRESSERAQLLRVRDDCEKAFINGESQYPPSGERGLTLYPFVKEQFERSGVYVTALANRTGYVISLIPYVQENHQIVTLDQNELRVLDLTDPDYDLKKRKLDE